MLWLLQAGLQHVRTSETPVLHLVMCRVMCSSTLHPRPAQAGHLTSDVTSEIMDPIKPLMIAYYAIIIIIIIIITMIIIIIIVIMHTQGLHQHCCEEPDVAQLGN